MVAITEKRDGFRAELVASEERLVRLRQDVSFASQSFPQFHIPAEVVSELERLLSMGSNAGPRLGVEGWRTGRRIFKRPSVWTTPIAFWS